MPFRALEVRSRAHTMHTSAIIVVDLGGGGGANALPSGG